MDKDWYKSKTVVSAIVYTLLSVYEMVTGNPTLTLDILQALSGLGVVWGLRDAIK